MAVNTLFCEWLPKNIPAKHTTNSLRYVPMSGPVGFAGKIRLADFGCEHFDNRGEGTYFQNGACSEGRRIDVTKPALYLKQGLFKACWLSWMDSLLTFRYIYCDDEGVMWGWKVEILEITIPAPLPRLELRDVNIPEDGLTCRCSVRSLWAQSYKVLSRIPNWFCKALKRICIPELVFDWQMGSENHGLTSRHG